MIPIDVKSILSKSVTPKLLSAFLSVAILIELMSGLKFYVNQESYAPPEKSRPASINTIVSIPRNKVVSAPLFGAFLPEDLSGVALKNSTLHVKLLGVILSDNENESEVILGLTNGEQRIYHVGDTVPGGAVIKRINRDEVYVAHDGAVEYLFLPEKGINLDSPEAGITFEK